MQFIKKKFTQVYKTKLSNSIALTQWRVAHDKMSRKPKIRCLPKKCPLSGELGREQGARIVVQKPDYVLAFYSARRIVFALDEDLLVGSRWESEKKGLLGWSAMVEFSGWSSLLGWSSLSDWSKFDDQTSLS